MIAKVVIFCAALAAVHCNGLYGAALINTGASVSSRQQDKLGNYAFGYDIVDGKGASNSRSEVGDAYGNKKGSYTLHDTDGRARKVEYVADKLGFRVAVKTNEPGTAASAPAAALIASPYSGPTMTNVQKHIAPVAVASVPLAVGMGHGIGAVGLGMGSMGLGGIGYGHGGMGYGLNGMGYGLGGMGYGLGGINHGGMGAVGLGGLGYGGVGMGKGLLL